MLMGLIFGAIWFGLFFIAHISLFYFRQVLNKFQAILYLYLAALSGCLISTWTVGEDILGSISGILVMFSLFILYMPFYYTISASLSVQTMIEIQQAPNQQRTFAELMQKFASEDIVQGRLESMVLNGYLVKQGEVYRLAAKGKFVSRIFRAIKKIWQLGLGG